MAKYTKQDIIKKAREVADMIAETEEVDFFKRAEAQLHQNEKVNSLISQIKALQKQAVNFQHYQKFEALKQTEEKINKLQDELDEIPIIQEFQSSQTEVNDLLQLVASTISNSVTDNIIESTGGDLLSGETGAQKNKGKDGCGCH